MQAVALTFNYQLLGIMYDIVLLCLLLNRMVKVNRDIDFQLLGIRYYI